MKRPENIRILKYAAFAALAFGGLCLVFPHLAAQSRSQGYVLEELGPAMAVAIGLGELLYWLGGRPLFAPMAMALTLALTSLVLALADRRDQKRFAPNVVLLVVAACFLIMYTCGSIDSFYAFVAGIAAVFILGFASRSYPPTSGDKAQKAGKAEIILVGAIVLLGLVIRLYKLDIFPRLFTADEQFFANAGLHLFGTGSDFFGEASWVKTHLIKLLCLRAGFSVLGVGMFQARVTSVLEGVLCIVLVYFLCRRMWGNAAGVFAAFLLSMDPWHHGYSRLGNLFIESPLFLLILFLLVSSAVKQGGKSRFVLLGLAIGATVYFYQSCYIMAPFAVAAVAAGIYFGRETQKTNAIKESLWLAPGAIIAFLPLLIFAGENLGALLTGQTMAKSFTLAAIDYNQSTPVAALLNLRAAAVFTVEFILRAEHPVNGFYQNAMIVGLALIGWGILARSRKNFENWMILLWIPIAFLPVTFGYGFADRRFFATFAPIPAMLAALPLAALWMEAAGAKPFQKALSRFLVVLLMAAIAFTSLFIVFEDCDLRKGGTPHPRKAPEFVNSIPSDYTILISSRINKFPFLLYIANYDKLDKEKGEKELYRVVNYEELESMAEKIAGESRIAIITNHQPRELEFLQKIKRMNPKTEITISDKYLACIIHGD